MWVYSGMGSSVGPVMVWVVGMATWWVVARWVTDSRQWWVGFDGWVQMGFGVDSNFDGVWMLIFCYGFLFFGLWIPMGFGFSTDWLVWFGLAWWWWRGGWYKMILGGGWCVGCPDWSGNLTHPKNRPDPTRILPIRLLRRVFTTRNRFQQIGFSFPPLKPEKPKPTEIFPNSGQNFHIPTIVFQNPTKKPRFRWCFP